MTLLKQGAPTKERKRLVPEHKHWAVDELIRAYGVRISVRSNVSGFFDRLAPHLPPRWQRACGSTVRRRFTVVVGGTGRANSSFHELYEGSTRVLKTRGLGRLLEDFERRAKMYVAEMARNHVFVHAGVVAWRGQAIVIPGRSMSGKTSLVAELVRAGATYYSDEYAAIDLRGRVQSYPQALAIRKPYKSRQRRFSVDKLGGEIGTKALPVRLILVSKYLEDGRWRPRKLTEGQSLLEMMAHTVPARRKPGVVVSTLKKAVLGATTLKSVRGEAKETAQLILSKMSELKPNHVTAGVGRTLKNVSQN